MAKTKAKKTGGKPADEQMGTQTKKLVKIRKVSGNNLGFWYRSQLVVMLYICHVFVECTFCGKKMDIVLMLS